MKMGRATVLALALGLSGCYALDPEMRRIVAARKVQAEQAPATKASPSMPPPAAPKTDAPPAPAPTAQSIPDVALVASQAVGTIATEYVLLALQIGTQEKGYIDAYYGPRTLLDAAIATPRNKELLLADARQLMMRLEALQADLETPSDRRRAAFLMAQLRAAETRLMMLLGTRFSFADEAERLFGIRPQIRPLASFDAARADVDALVPGDAPLAARVEAFLDRFTIPADRLRPVFDAAIAQCRDRTADHVAMPAGENFDLQFVKNKSWSGYNFYLGSYRSIIQVNTDLPVRLSRALDLGCHEGYPGHHLFNMKIEEQLVKGREWPEFSVYPLYSPQSLLAEGTANYGIDLAFPGESRADTERRVLMPLAGMTPPETDQYWRLLDAIKRLQGARLTIAQQYLDGEIDRATAVALMQQYLLVSAERAEQMANFTDTYRSYVINYSLGEQLVRSYLERGQPGQDEIWRRMTRILSEPTLPADLL